MVNLTKIFQDRVNEQGKNLDEGCISLWLNKKTQRLHRKNAFSALGDEHANIGAFPGKCITCVLAKDTVRMGQGPPAERMFLQWERLTMSLKSSAFQVTRFLDWKVNKWVAFLLLLWLPRSFQDGEGSPAIIGRMSPISFHQPYLTPP